ncbi:MAG TPA: glycosyltransferase family 39 protein, partial [Gemmatimonadaceae bacterium]
SGGIWADEGSFLNVVAAPSWREMIDFLKVHESHPPLFYMMMRAWARVAPGDTATMLLPVLLGAAIVPAMFIAGRALFDERVGLICAVFAAFASQLVEHASQLRPYGLLSLLALISASAMALAMTGSRRRAWTVYVVATALMLYTHSWGWLIFGGQQLAVVPLLLRQKAEAPLREWFICCGLVVLAYSPWLPSLLYQVTHAGHGSLPIDGVEDTVRYLLFGFFRIVESVLTGRLAARETVSVAALAAAILAVATATFSHRRNAGGDHHPVGATGDVRFERSRFIRNVVLASLAAAMIVSPLNNLLLPRGIASVVPLLLLVVGFWSGEVLAKRATLQKTQLTVLLVSFGIVCSIFELPALIGRPRSNAREVALEINANKRPTDLLVVAPEWFAPSFDHYFPPSIEQIDYPFTGRGSLISFSNVWETRQKSNPLPGLQARLLQARADGRRVWFVSERDYLRDFRGDDLEKAFRHRVSAAYSLSDVHTIKSTLERLYGPPKVVIEPRRNPVHDELLGYLFSPPEPAG